LGKTANGAIQKGYIRLAKLRSYLDGLAIWSSAAPRPARARTLETRKINLALQGGGAHGAFSWGVADRLLADERIAIAGLSGTLNEITFNSALHTELRTLNSINRLIDDGHLPNGFGRGAFRRLNVHRIDLGSLATRLSASSKLKTDYQFFALLHRAGQRAARKFLDVHFDDLGVRSAIDVEAEAGVEWG